LKSERFTSQAIQRQNKGKLYHSNAMVRYEFCKLAAKRDIKRRGKHLTFKVGETEFLTRHIESFLVNILSKNELKQQEVSVNKGTRIAKEFCIRFLEITVACGNEFVLFAVVIGLSA